MKIVIMLLSLMFVACAPSTDNNKQGPTDHYEFHLSASFNQTTETEVHVLTRDAWVFAAHKIKYDQFVPTLADVHPSFAEVRYGSVTCFYHVTQSESPWLDLINCSQDMSNGVHLRVGDEIRMINSGAPYDKIEMCWHLSNGQMIQM